MDFDISFYFPKIKRITIRYKKFRRGSSHLYLEILEKKKKRKKPDISISISCNYIEMHTLLFLFLICEKVRRKGRIRSKAPPFDQFSLSLFFLHRCKRPPPTRREIEASLIRASSTLIPPSPNGYYTAKARTLQGKLLIRRVMDPKPIQLIRVARPYPVCLRYTFSNRGGCCIVVQASRGRKDWRACLKDATFSYLRMDYYKTFQSKGRKVR